MKKIFTLTCLILASIVGAGFASGKEIYVFFTRYGIVSFVSILLSFFLFFYLIKLYLDFGRVYKPKNFLEANKIIFKKYSGIFNIFFIACYFIVLAGMFAGVYEIYLNIASPLWARVLVLVTVVFCIIENAGGINAINFVNNIFIPITMVILIISACIGLTKINNHNIASSVSSLTVFKSVTSLISYVGINILLTCGVLIQEGKKYSKKTILGASFAGALILCLTIMLFNCVILIFKINSEMPMLTLSFSINYWWGIVVLLCVWYCIYSAITSITYVLAESFNKRKYGNILTNLIVVVIGYIISLCGFSNIVMYFYPVIGVVGIIFSILVILKIKTDNKKYYAKCKKL